jgi:carbonic anhydrase
MTRQLIEGFKLFRKKEYESKSASMPALIRDGQHPKYFIISCIDSRANPGFIFNPAPGTFFAHKAMGAIVRPYKQGTALAAALQFALEYNKVETIIVLGHTNCGAVKALVENIEDKEISGFVEVACSGLEKAKAQTESDDETCIYRATEEQIVLLSAKNLLSYPSVAKAVQEHRVVIKPWLFDLHEGALLEHSPTENLFIPLIDTQESSTQI